MLIVYTHEIYQEVTYYEILGPNTQDYYYYVYNAPYNVTRFWS